MAGENVWDFAYRRESNFTSCLGQVALAIGSVAVAIHYEDGKYLFIAQVFALITLGWGAAIAVLANYDYRIVQALSWAKEQNDHGEGDIMPENFGRPKGDLIWLYKIHLIMFLLIAFLIVYVGHYLNKPTFFCYCNGCICPSIQFAILCLLIILIWLLIYERNRKFDDNFGSNWQRNILS